MRAFVHSGEPVLKAIDSTDGPDPRLAEFRQAVLLLPKGQGTDDYRQLRAALDDLLHACGGGSLAWREASLLLDAAFLQDAQRNFGLLEWIRQEYLGRQDVDGFAAFWADVRRVLHPRTLSPHGYLTSLESRDSAQVWRDVGVLQEKLAALGYVAFINSGTLLGVVRDGTFIAHDDDVDLAVVMHSDSVAGVAREWRRLKQALAASWLLDAEFERKGNTHCKIGCAGGASVDLFPAWLDGDRVWVWPYLAGGATRDQLLPLQASHQSGVRVYLPKRAEALLEHNYGADWRTPDPTFRFDWKRAGQQFEDFLAAHRSTRESP